MFVTLELFRAEIGKLLNSLGPRWLKIQSEILSQESNSESDRAGYLLSFYGLCPHAQRYMFPHVHVPAHSETKKQRGLHIHKRRAAHLYGRISLSHLAKDSRVSLFKQGQDMHDLSIGMAFLTLRNTKAALLDWRYTGK